MMLVSPHFALNLSGAPYSPSLLALTPLNYRMVYELLENEFKQGLHALNINAKTPEEVAKAAAKQNQVN